MQFYKRKNELIEAELDEDLVMLDVEQGKYFALNSIGKRIWELLSEARTKEELMTILLNEYEVEPKLCEEELSIYLKSIKKANLLDE